MNPRHLLLAASLCVSLWLSVAPAMAGSAATAADLTSAEVRKIDAENKRVTLKHGEIKNLQMPAMTMVFRVRDSAMLQQLKVGAEVQFAAEKENGALYLTMVQAAP